EGSFLHPLDRMPLHRHVRTAPAYCKGWERIRTEENGFRPLEHLRLRVMNVPRAFPFGLARTFPENLKPSDLSRASPSGSGFSFQRVSVAPMKRDRTKASLATPPGTGAQRRVLAPRDLWH